ncbi:hypothetical protein V8C42DRAFT_71091 [Trichoderma barbatum]
MARKNTESSVAVDASNAAGVIAISCAGNSIRRRLGAKGGRLLVSSRLERMECSAIERIHVAFCSSVPSVSVFEMKTGCGEASPSKLAGVLCHNTRIGNTHQLRSWYWYEYTDVRSIELWHRAHNCWPVCTFLEIVGSRRTLSTLVRKKYGHGMGLNHFRYHRLLAGHSSYLSSRVVGLASFEFYFSRITCYWLTPTRPH